MSQRPDASEYATFYAAYVDAVPDGDIVSILERQMGDTVARLSLVSDARASEPYAPAKWTIKDVVGHLIDAERVFTYRALRFARGDETPLASFEHDDYVRAAGATDRALGDLVAEFATVRAATVALFRSLPVEAYDRVGTASDRPVSVRALAYIIAGHERHHLRVFEQAGVFGGRAAAEA
jgi:hypothetical protein